MSDWVLHGTQGQISLTDTSLEPSISRTRPTTPEEKLVRWKGPFLSDAQAACCCNRLGSKLAPFFHRVRVDGGNVSCQGKLGHGGAHPTFHPRYIKIVPGPGAGAGRDGRPFQEIFHMVIMVVIQTPHRECARGCGA